MVEWSRFYNSLHFTCKHKTPSHAGTTHRAFPKKGTTPSHHTGNISKGQVIPSLLAPRSQPQARLEGDRLALASHARQEPQSLPIRAPEPRAPLIPTEISQNPGRVWVGRDLKAFAHPWANLPLDQVAQLPSVRHHRAKFWISAASISGEALPAVTRGGFGPTHKCPN